jgi:nitronate monooxygenase
LGAPLPRWSVPSPIRQTTGAIDAMAMCAGESVSAVKKVQPAAEIVKELAEQVEQHLREWATRLGGAGAR